MIQLWFELTFVSLFIILIFVGSVSVPVYILTARGRWLWAGAYCLLTVLWMGMLHHVTGQASPISGMLVAEMWWNQYWWVASLLFYGVIGAVLGVVVRRQGSPTAAILIPVLAGALVAVAAVAGMLVVGPGHLGQPVHDFMATEIRQTMDQVIAMVREAPAEQVALLQEMGRQMTAASVRMLPAAIWLMGLVVTALTLLIGKYFVPRVLWMKYQGGLTRWKAPGICVWVVIVLGGVFFANYYGMKLQMLQPVVANGLLGMAGLFLLQGAMIVTYYIRRQREGFFRWMWYALMALFFQTTVMIMMVLGLFDYWADFRKIEKRIRL